MKVRHTIEKKEQLQAMIYKTLHRKLKIRIMGANKDLIE